MREKRVWRSITVSTLILLVLVGCRVSSEPPTASPTPETITIEEETIVEFVCPCFAIVTMDAYLDQNENGKRDADEPPLEGVGFRLEWSDLVDPNTSRKQTGSARSDATGHAERTVKGCGCDDVDVYPEVPPGYKLTTADRCGSGACTFGFAALPGTLKSLREADLHGADLQRENLRFVDLSGADLREADLHGADLSSADLSGADLRGADLRQADLFWTDLRGAQLDDATQIGAKWLLVWEIVSQGARGRDLSDADLSAADLSGADLHGADLREADLSRSHLSKADLGEADLSGANLSETDLREVELVGAILHGAALTEADLGGAHLREADLQGANLSVANLVLLQSDFDIIG